MLTILSPHRDDAAFSLYGSLLKWHRSGIRLAVLNFFTISAYAPRISTREPEDVSRIRKAEDRSVLSRIGRNIRVRDCGLLDAPLRLGIDSAAVCRPDTQRFASASGREIAAMIDRHARSELIIAPLGVGGHVDHVAVYEAAIAAVSPRRGRLAFYEDLPYATWTPDGILTDRIRQTEAKTRLRLQPAVIRQKNAIWRKQGAISQYRSQITPEEAASIAKFTIRYGGGERLWIPRRSRIWTVLAE
ncbi:MAG TPA: PIG-L family deacetylase [Bryobacteraceae bacterium]